MTTRARLLGAILAQVLLAGACMPADEGVGAGGSPGSGASLGAAGPASQAAQDCAGPQADGSRLPDIVEAWAAFWNEDERAAKAAILDRIWAEGATYTDPYGDGPIVDPEVLLDAVDYGMGPGQYIEPRGWDPDDLHHDRVRMRWRHCCPNGFSYLSGTDIGWIDPNGRFTKIISFWANPVDAPADGAC